MTGAEIQERIEIDQALAAARRVPNFVFLPAGATPEITAALRAYGASSRKQIMEPPAPSHVAALAAEHQARGMPTIAAGDDGAFLKNLQKIAKGEVRVK